ncbi:MAG: RNA polymerase sigma factor [Lachnospiraceae bacterium]|nr:RNA polymerase sigma factor [Lachnospiraceae bacterium]
MTKNELEQLIELHGNDIYRFCYHLTGCRDDADDLYQDTLCKVYEIGKRIKKTEDGPLLEKERNYCLGIAVRLYKNSYRKKTKQAEESLDDELKKFSEEPVSELRTEEIVEKKEMQLKVRNSIRLLPLKQRTVIYLFYYAELSIKDISALLRIPSGTVKSRLNKAKSSLKNELEEIWYE